MSVILISLTNCMRMIIAMQTVAVLGNYAVLIFTASATKGTIQQNTVSSDQHYHLLLYTVHSILLTICDKYT